MSSGFTDIKFAFNYLLFQELVTKVFQQMWFTPLKGDENSDVLVKRVVHMTDVVRLFLLNAVIKFLPLPCLF